MVTCDVCLPDWSIKNAVNAPLIKTTGDTDLTWWSAHVYWLKHGNGARLCHAHRLCLILCNIVLVVDGHILTCLKLKMRWGCQFLIRISKSSSNQEYIYVNEAQSTKSLKSSIYKFFIRKSYMLFHLWWTTNCCNCHDIIICSIQCTNSFLNLYIIQILSFPRMLKIWM